MKPPVETLMARLRELVGQDSGLTALDLLSIARPSARLITQQTSQSQIALGESRIGGTPDLPPWISWPRWLPSKERDDKFGRRWHPESPAPLGFVAQIDLLQVPRIDDRLPDSGWLFFFYDRYCEPWGYDPADRGCCRVLYADCDRSLLRRTQPPPDGDSEHLAGSCQLKIVSQLTLPDHLEGVEYGSPIYDAYLGLREELAGESGSTQHRLLGYPQLIQNPMELECQLASNGIYCGGPEGYQSAQAKRLSDGARDWQLLLQIDTDEEGPGWMWGDVGRIYFWIKGSDLAALQFDNPWLIFQCF